MKHVEIFTDGSCLGNPGKGGWGVILRYGTVTKELSGADPDTTNNRMELTAAIQGLYALKEPCEVTLTSDSKYLCDGINNGWVKSWEKNGWRKSNKKQAENIDLWKTLLFLNKIHDVKYVWVKGHNGHPENERCDSLAVNACQKLN